MSEPVCVETPAVAVKPLIRRMQKALSFVDPQLDLKAIVDETERSVEWILGILDEHNCDFRVAKGQSKVTSVNAKNISDGKGYCSRVFKTVVEFDDKNKPAYSFILKIPTCDKFSKMNLEISKEDLEQTRIMISEMHDVECETYELLQNITDFPMPRTYYIQRSSEDGAGVLMMEDLSQGTTSMGLFTSITENHCHNLAKHMADFQTQVNFMPGRPWKDSFLVSIHCKPENDDMWLKWLKPGLEHCEKYDQELRSKMDTILSLSFAKLGEHTLIEVPKKYDSTTLCHGDMWTNNMLISTHEDGSISDTIRAIIDWQTLFQGNPLFDIARFISNCADADIRRGCEKEVVERYYARLCKNYEKYGAKPAFTLEQAHELYELAFAQECLLVMIMFGIIAAPLKDNGNPADQAKITKLWLRVRFAIEDMTPLIEKYDLERLCVRESAKPVF